MVGLFLSLLDTTIVAVSLAAIANYFQEFDRSTWVVNAYLISYMAFAIIISRLSDPFGRKPVQVASFVVFIAFSMGCALSRTMTQLIVFRALQGVGGSGLYSMCMVIAMTMMPPEKRSMMGAYIAVSVVTAGVLGPILGGLITHSRDSTTWPWIFWINVPVAGVSLSAMIFAWPRDKISRSHTLAASRSIDFLGGFLLLAAAALLVFALQEAGTFEYAWDSAAIVVSLVFSGVCFVAFVSWQKIVMAHPAWLVKVVFPVDLVKRRVVAAAILSMLLTGFMYYTIVVNLPTRFQIASGDSPVVAGARLLPLLVFSGIGSVAGGMLSLKRNNTAYVLVAASAFQLLGYGLMTTLGGGDGVPAKNYGFQIFVGLGFGMNMSSGTHMMHLALQKEPQWIAVAQGALAQMRTLGGSIGLAVAVTIFNYKVRTSDALVAALSPSQMDALYRSPLVIETFAPGEQQLAASVFAGAFVDQMRVATYVAAACFVVSLLTVERNPPQAIARGPA